MTTGAIVLSWGASIPGRESKGLEVFGRALQWAADEAKTGRIHSHKEYFSLQDDLGFQILEGELETLVPMLLEDRTRDLILSAEAIVQDFKVRICQGGSDASVQEGMTRYTDRLGELGYM